MKEGGQKGRAETRKGKTKKGRKEGEKEAKGRKGKRR